VRDQPLPHMPLVIETNKPKNAPGKRSDEAWKYGVSVDGVKKSHIGCEMAWICVYKWGQSSYKPVL
jgi:hypothetical protein